jgi:hypothetical protein
MYIQSIVKRGSMSKQNSSDPHPRPNPHSQIPPIYKPYKKYVMYINGPSSHQLPNQTPTAAHRPPTGLKRGLAMFLLFHWEGNFFLLIIFPKFPSNPNSHFHRGFCIFVKVRYLTGANWFYNIFYILFWPRKMF